MKLIFIILPVPVILLFAFFTMSQNTQPAYKKQGSVYVVNSPGKTQSVLSISVFKNEKDTSWSYWLQLTDIKSNAIIQKKEIAVAHGKPLEHEQFIGRLGNIIWIVTDSLVGYNEQTLEPVATEELITAANPFMKDNISRHHYSYLLDEGAGVMYIRGVNDERYKLYPGNLTLKPDNGINELAPDDYSYEVAGNYKLYDRCELKTSLTCIDTSNNRLFILGSEKETGFVLSYFGTAIYPDRNESRQITIVPYHADGEKLDYKNNPPVINTRKYFAAGFLQNKFATSAWKGKQGERIVLYQSNNTGKGTLSAALVDIDGKEKWSVDTNITPNKFNDYVFCDENLLLWFDTTGYSTVVNIDLSSGKLVK